MTHQAIDVTSALHAALVSSMSARDNAATGALRAALADLANAEAVQIEDGAAAVSDDQHIAGSSAGLGAAEVPRRSLSEAEARDIVEREVAARRISASQFRAQGRAKEASDLARGADVLEAALRSLLA